MIRSWRGRWLAAMMLGGLAVLLAGCPAPEPGPEEQPTGINNYLFCFWNTENFFDDQDDGRKTRGDAEYDTWFASDKAALETKLDHMCKVLLPLNNGKGPDILAVAELESLRSAELLQEALNKRLNKPALNYTNILMEPVVGGRHINTAILTRLPVDGNRTHLLDKRRRILEGRVKVNGKPLILISSHWTSHLTDKKGEGRAKYADIIYGRFKAMYIANPRIDVLVCGDFNDSPDDPTVTEHLHATGDRNAVLASGGRDPLLFNLFAGPWKAGEASYIYGSKRKPRKDLFDQVCVSPGMLDDEGWWCDPASATVVKQMADADGRPNRFGSEKDRRSLDQRGASDHFPVTVRLSVR